MVTLLPCNIRWFNAVRGYMRKFSSDFPRKGPPKLVRYMFSIGFLSFPCKALDYCGMSRIDGVDSTVLRRCQWSDQFTRQPPAFPYSQGQYFVPELSALIVGRSPAKPTRAFRTISFSFNGDYLFKLFSPVCTSRGREDSRRLQPYFRGLCLQRARGENFAPVNDQVVHITSGEDSIQFHGLVGKIFQRLRPDRTFWAMYSILFPCFREWDQQLKRDIVFRVYGDHVIPKFKMKMGTSS
jgi:hypothetical protein